MSESNMILIVGPAACGKSSTVDDLVEQGYVRLNRDEAGGSIASLIPHLEKSLASGQNVVLDNTFLTAEVRKPFLDVAKKHGAKAIARYMKTTIEDAQVNACHRLINLGIDPTDVDGIKASKHPNVFPSIVLFSHYKQFQIPTTDEGFDEVAPVSFLRQPQTWEQRGALMFDYDGTLRKTKSGDKYPCHPDDVEILPGRAEKLQNLAAQGTILLGASNQSGVAKGKPTAEDVIKCFDRTNELLGVDIDYLFCPHPAGPPVCWCRKPLPGMAVKLFRKYNLSPILCTYVGDMTSDKTFAKRAGMQFVMAEDFFS